MITNIKNTITNIDIIENFIQEHLINPCNPFDRRTSITVNGKKLWRGDTKPYVTFQHFTKPKLKFSSKIIFNYFILFHANILDKPRLYTSLTEHCIPQLLRFDIDNHSNLPDSFVINKAFQIEHIFGPVVWYRSPGGKGLHGILRIYNTLPMWQLRIIIKKILQDNNLKIEYHGESPKKLLTLPFTQNCPLVYFENDQIINILPTQEEIHETLELCKFKYCPEHLKSNPIYANDDEVNKEIIKHWLVFIHGWTKVINSPISNYSFTEKENAEKENSIKRSSIKRSLKKFKKKSGELPFTPEEAKEIPCTFTVYSHIAALYVRTNIYFDPRLFRITDQPLIEDNSTTATSLEKSTYLWNHCVNYFEEKFDPKFVRGSGLPLWRTLKDQQDKLSTQKYLACSNQDLITHVKKSCTKYNLPINIKLINDCKEFLKYIKLFHGRVSCKTLSKLFGEEMYKMYRNVIFDVFRIEDPFDRHNKKCRRWGVRYYVPHVHDSYSHSDQTKAKTEEKESPKFLIESQYQYKNRNSIHGNTKNSSTNAPHIPSTTPISLQNQELFNQIDQLCLFLNT